MKRVAFVLAASAISFLLVACGDNKPTSTGTSHPVSNNSMLGDAGSLSATVAAKVEYNEADFTESDRNRDPFRSYASTFAPEAKKQLKSQIDAVLPQYSIDELKLVAIVTGGDYPRAMLLDPGNKGWVIKRGDYIGRPDVVHVGGTNGSDYQLNWRVDRVRDGDVVLIRQDPSQPAIPPATRVIPLHPEGEGKTALDQN